MSFFERSDGSSGLTPTKPKSGQYLRTPVTRPTAAIAASVTGIQTAQQSACSSAPAPNQLRSAMRSARPTFFVTNRPSSSA